MAQRRYFEKDAVYRLRNRTLNGEALFTPNDAVSKIIENNLAWAADTHAVKLIGFQFQPDMFELIVNAPHLNISDFMGDFQGLTARQINAYHGRNGQFFAGRYKDAKLEEDVQLESLIHVLRTPVSRGFVEHVSDWKGVSSLSLYQSGEPLLGYRQDSAEMRRIRRNDPTISEEEARQLATTMHVVELTPLPECTTVSADRYRERMDALCPEAQLRSPRGEAQLLKPEDNDPVDAFGMNTVCDWPFTRRLQNHLPDLPVYLTRNPRKREAFYKKLESKNLYYEWARKRLRNGLPNPRFPRGMIPLHKTRPVGATRPRPRETARAGPH